MEEWFTVKRVHPRVWAIAEFHHWEKVVSYLAIGRREAVLIDTGMGYADVVGVARRLTDKPVTAYLTHAHWDHIGSVSSITDVRVFDHPFETRLLGRGFASNDIPELMDPSLFSPPFVPKRYEATGTSVHTAVKEGMYIHGDMTVQIIHTPGHTPGSVCYLVHPYGLLFTGDTLYPGPLYAYLPESDWRQYIISVKNLDAVSSDVAAVFPGHNSTREEASFLKQAAGEFEAITLRISQTDDREIVCGTFSFLWKD